MLKIQHIHIAFDETLIEDGTLCVAGHELTVVKGESGSGKTSLLSVAGLLTHDKNSHYVFNGHSLKMIDKEMSKFRKQHIGYVFQENSLIEHLSIYENMKLYCSMVDRKINEQEARALLKSVRLDQDLNQTTITLSGGERQRLAIACALSKQPELLILDEPTSALDKKNTQVIMDILKQLASEGMMVLIASHDELVISQCDVVYEIKDKQLLRSKESTDENKILNLKSVHLGLKFYLSYYLNYLKENYAIHLLMFAMCGFAIATLIGFNAINIGFEKKQIESLDAIGNREIFVTSKRMKDGNVRYREDLPEMNDTMISRIQKNPNCEVVYPFYESWSNSLILNGEKKDMAVVIQPYAKEKRIYDYLYLGENVENGIYISYALAKQLEIKEITNDTISSSIYLPDGSEFQLEELKISGVLDNNVENWYSGAKAIIYVPVEKLPKLDKVQSLLVYATHFDTTFNLVQEMKEIDSDLGLFNHYSRVDYLNKAFDEMKTFGPMIIGMIVLITIIMVFLIYSRYMGNRKKEICLLKVNGLSRVETVYLIINELVIQALSVAVFSFIFMNILYLLMSHVLNIGIEFSYLKDYIYSLVFAFVFMAVPSIISLIVYQRYDVAVALRND